MVLLVRDDGVLGAVPPFARGGNLFSKWDVLDVATCQHLGGCIRCSSDTARSNSLISLCFSKHKMTGDAAAISAPQYYVEQSVRLLTTNYDKAGVRMNRPIAGYIAEFLIF